MFLNQQPLSSATSEMLVCPFATHAFALVQHFKNRVFGAQMSFRDLCPINGEHERLGRVLCCSKSPLGVDSVKEMSSVTHLLQRFRTVAPS